MEGKDAFAGILYGAFYSTEFEPLTATNDFIGKRYRDREWGCTRIAVSY